MNFLTTAPMPLLRVGSSCSLHFPGIWNMVMELVLTAHRGTCPPCNVRSCKGANENIFSTGPRSPPVETFHSGLHYKGLCTSTPCRVMPLQEGPCVSTWGLILLEVEDQFRKLPNFAQGRSAGWGQREAVKRVIFYIGELAGLQFYLA